MEQNREPRNKPTLLWLINLGQKRQEYTMGKRQSLKYMVWETVATCRRMKLERVQKYIYKNKLKIKAQKP